MIPAAGQVLRSRRLVATAILAPPLAWLLAQSGHIPFFAALAAMAVFCLVVMSAGILLLRWPGAAEQPAASAWVLGVFSTGLAVFALVELLRVPAFECFALWAIAVLLADAVAMRRASRQYARVDYRDMLGLALCALVTLMWCRGIASAPDVLDRERVLPAWIDYFIHGGVISQFGDVRSLGHRSYDLADFPLRLYHYASYQLPAAFAEPLDLPGLTLATSVWLPLGFLTMCAGAYALGVALAGQVGGLAALASLSLIPDAASYGLRNSVYSYYWNILSSPGSAYAIGVALLSFAFLHRYTVLRSARALIAGAALAAGALLFRANVFVLAFPAWLAAAGASLPSFRKRRLVYAALLLAFVALARLAIYVVADSLPGWNAIPVVDTFLRASHLNQEPTAYAGWYERLIEYGPEIAVPAGIGLVFLACLGAFVLLCPAALLLERRRWRVIDCLPVLVVVFYVLLMIWAPVPPHGDAQELTHRPFIVVYAVIAVWTVTLLANRVALRYPQDAVRLWTVFFAAALLGTAMMWSQVAAMGRLKAFWGRDLETYVVEEGVPQAAAFLRRNARPADIFAVSGLTLDPVITDVPTQLASLSGLSAYVARPFVQMVTPGPREQLARSRYEALVRVERAPNADSALALLRNLGIRWYAFVGADGPDWDRGRSRAVFVNGKIAVYSSAER
jgi:hypothetical protein